MANLLIFIHNGGIWKLLYSPDLKMVLILLDTKVFQEGTFFKWVYVSLSHEILRHAMVGVFSDECSTFLDIMNDIGIEKKQQPYIIKEMIKYSH